MFVRNPTLNINLFYITLNLTSIRITIIEDVMIIYGFDSQYILFIFIAILFVFFFFDVAILCVAIILTIGCSCCRGCRQSTQWYAIDKWSNNNHPYLFMACREETKSYYVPKKCQYRSQFMPQSIQVICPSSFYLGEEGERHSESTYRQIDYVIYLH